MLVTHALETKAKNATVALIVRDGTVAAKFHEELGFTQSETYTLRSGKKFAPDPAPLGNTLNVLSLDEALTSHV